MAKTENHKLVTSTPIVEDPHPGSISDGTHPSAREHRQPTPTKGIGNAERVSGTAGKPNLKEGQTAVNSEAPRHPNKGAYGS